jgi:hypothetical protein
VPPTSCGVYSTYIIGIHTHLKRAKVNPHTLDKNNVWWAILCACFFSLFLTSLWGTTLLRPPGDQCVQVSQSKEAKPYKVVINEIRPLYYISFGAFPKPRPANLSKTNIRMGLYVYWKIGVFWDLWLRCDEDFSSAFLKSASTTEHIPQPSDKPVGETVTTYMNGTIWTLLQHVKTESHSPLLSISFYVSICLLAFPSLHYFIFSCLL